MIKKLTFIITCFASIISRGADRIETEQTSQSQILSYSVLASVDGEPITLRDIIRKCGSRRLTAEIIEISNNLNNSKNSAALRRIVDQFITNKLILLEFNKAGYTVPKQLIEDKLDMLSEAMKCKNRTELDRKLKQGGSSLTEARTIAKEQTAVELMYNSLQQKSTNCTPHEIYSYYQGNKEKFKSSDTYHLNAIAIGRKVRPVVMQKVFAQQCHDEIKTNTLSDFEIAATKYSDLKSRNNKGFVATLQAAELQKGFAAAIEQNGLDKAIGPLILGDDFYFIYARLAEKGKTTPFTEVQKRIGTTLKAQKFSVEKKKFIAKLKESSRVNYNF